MYNPPVEIIKRVGMYLGITLPSNRDKLIEHLTGLEATRYKLAEARVDWLLLLYEKKNQMLHPKDKDLTELDRRVMLNASIGVIERDYEFLVKLEQLVEERLTFGQKLLDVLKG